MTMYKEVLKEVLAYYKGIQALYEGDISNGPDGKLLVQVDDGRRQFIHAFNRDDRRVRHGINRDEKLIRELARSEFARKALKILDADIALLESTLRGLIPFDLDEILGSMTDAYKLLPEEYFFNRESTVIDLNLSGADKARIERHREWGNSPYKISNYRPEDRNKRTSRGEFVRSKSELLIVETMYRYGLPKHYEQEQEIDGFLFDPDFTFEAEDGSLFFWEHLGMMDDPGYARRNLNKLNRIYNAGIIPGDNLILTFDRNGTINMGMINAVIENEVIPRM